MGFIFIDFLSVWFCRLITLLSTTIKEKGGWKMSQAQIEKKKKIAQKGTFKNKKKQN